tara:strand:- start:181 stop:660 length:480 start_codon:yes stop_codon:yes gene_type:complete
LETSKQKLIVKQLSELVSKLSTLPEKERNILLGKMSSPKGLPISIFNSELSGLEALTVYLKDHQNKSIKEISTLLNRNISTLYTTYTKAKQKLTGKLIVDYSVVVPIQIFSNRKFSVLEVLVSNLKNEQNLGWNKIAELLGKSYSTVRTVYRRYLEKCS